MKWFKSDKEIIDEVIDKSMDKFYEDRVNNLMDRVEKLEKQNIMLEFQIQNPPKYKLGQVVNGHTIYEINCLDYEVVRFCRFNTPSWEYKGIDKNGNKISV